MLSSSRYGFAGGLMHFHAIKFFYESSGRKTVVCHAHWIPRDRQQMTDARRLGGRLLPMAAREADRQSYSPNLGFFRNFIFANRSRSGDDRAGAGVTGISGEVKVVLSHGGILLSEEQGS
jgi:hypothetical protein